MCDQINFVDLDPQGFLENYWQKKPLLIKNGFAYLREVLEPEELAGLSCEQGVESRLILEKGGVKPWEVRHGPFEEDDFTTLPQDSWTLLVQGVEQWIPEVYQLLESFRFVPNWRVDDVMVSYAPDGGSVGAHVDQYDVFLIQGFGQREWRIGKEPLKEELIIPGLDVKILQEFNDYEALHLDLGDVLYLPPGIAHHGIAKGRSMTYSVGFRAPHNKELAGHFADHVLLHGRREVMYRDPDLELQESSGEMNQASLDRLFREVQATLGDRDLFNDFVGRYMTLPKYDHKPEPQDPTCLDDLRDDDVLEPFLGARMLYQKTHKLVLYINGEPFPVEMEALPVVKALCDSKQAFLWGELKSAALRCNGLGLLQDLVKEGWLLVADPTEDDGSRKES
ncbi:cupin domain-containing protein [Pseudobacteriovorax antillogorgiicola]|uniref:50S ribosomal protein L16 3-hydroxylase n=1 Tax=Pseudobacteriovorax antillogorgiicola TaxID=1513793 RepID=A0A1Y6CNE6_9BACT|nr:cupin domain-containing protein [Pseudobacteriovorax antillogorgiicola]TCS47266.1 50S ribosomal protein L16 3-hydroxylase [Pseudobacteriovorax antillogorgiicola]SMF62146.1 50S ribosomal protein L16 3-hydroxylase [Pseudobacteriovorax antillogorgiicola]